MFKKLNGKFSKKDLIFFGALDVTTKVKNPSYNRPLRIQKKRLFYSIQIKYKKHNHKNNNKITPRTKKRKEYKIIF